jgi:pilus assembly protein CpaC
MFTGTRIRPLIFLVLLALAGTGATLHAVDDTDEITTLRLLVGRSAVVDTGAPIARVSLTSPEIADALVTEPDQLLIQGKLPGTISMFVWDRAGAMRRYDVTVERDLSQLTAHIRNLFPGERIEVAGNGRTVVVSGTVSSQYVADKAVEIAAGHVEKKEDVVNLLQVRDEPPPQVLLKVRFAEVSRSALTELGASFFTSPLGVEDTIGRITTQQFPAPGYDRLQWTKEGPNWGDRVTSSSGEFTFSDFLNIFLLNKRYDLGLMVRALQNRGLFQSLAEPNLVAESGREASFLAGGEFPIPVAQAGTANISITVQFKEFGVRLTFTPTVLDDSRIHLKVRPEVSTLDFTNAVVLQGFRIPALSTRRTETELELENGQTFAIAGLLNNTMTESLQKVPGIGDIPILGLLFRSKAAQKNRTELLVMITPHILPPRSAGVARELPPLREPYLDPLPPDQARPNPAPAFPQPPGSAQVVPEPARDRTAQDAAAVLRSRLPKAPTLVTPEEITAPRGTASPSVTPGSSSLASAAAATAMPGDDPSTGSAPEATGIVAPAAAGPQIRPLTREEMRRLEKAREEERKAEERRRKEAEKAERQRLEDERKAAERLRRQQEQQRREAEKEAREAAERARRPRG